MHIGKHLQQLRKTANYTQEQLARKAGISYSTLAKIERGAINDPSYTTVMSILSAMDCNPSDLTNGTTASHTLGNSISFIYCDVNGVLVRFFQRAFVSLAAKIDRDVNAVETAFWHYNASANKGEMTTKQFNAALAKRLGVSAAGIDWENEYMAGIEAVKPMHDCIIEVSKTMPVGLLTNIFPDFVQSMIKSGLLPDIDYAAIVDSSEVGTVKPEQKIYKIAEKMSGVDGSEILFIDDSRTNLIEAERHSWKVLWFDDYRPSESVKRVKLALKSN